MTDRPVVLIGGGGHALVVAESLHQGAELVGFYDDNPDAVLSKRGFPCLGPFSEIPPDLGPWYILALGNLPIRRVLLERLAGASTVGVTHASAFVSPTAQIGRGVFVGPRAVIHTDALVHHHAIINSAAVVEHECVIGENTHVAPGAVLGGNVHVGPDTLVGLGSRVLPGIRIGAGCTIAAGAVVIRDVPDGHRVAGVPARRMKD